jgi:hypothetical protein
LPAREFTPDSQLRFAPTRHVFQAQAPFELGADYRLAHLPLVSPGHPRAIAAMPGKDYRNGRYSSARDALVVHVPAAVLDESPVFQTIEADLKASAAGSAIAWDIGRRRRDALHATIAGPFDPIAGDACARAAHAWLGDDAAPAIRLGGPFVGDRNHGRIYLRIYPACRDGTDAYADLQRAAGARVSGFYAVGLWHLARDLDPSMAAELAAWLDRHWAAEIAVIPQGRLAMLRTTDDLAVHSPEWRWIDEGGPA